jgi:hypothetical protein
MGVILYLMTYGKLPFQHIKNQYQLIFALTDPSKKEIQFAPVQDEFLKDTLDVNNYLKYYFVIINLFLCLFYNLKEMFLSRTSRKIFDRSTFISSIHY